MSNAAFLGEQITAYRTSRTGYLTNPGSDFLAFEHLPEDLLATLSNATRSNLAAAFPEDWPHLQHTFADAFYGTGVDMLAGDAFTPRDGRNYVSILPTLVATFSRGNVTINSTDTAVNPVINAGLLSDPRDQELAIAAFKRARQIATATALKPIMAGEEVYPGPDVQTDAEILDNIKASTAPIWHAAGTCKMGKATDEMAVVDSEARVYGVTQLRVVDASAFPLLVPCHPQATVCKSYLFLTFLFFGETRTNNFLPSRCICGEDCSCNFGCLSYGSYSILRTPLSSLTHNGRREPKMVTRLFLEVMNRK